MKTTTKDRFEKKIFKSNGCWIWTGCLDSGGYGKVHVSGRTLGAHWVSYEIYVGPIPEGLTIDHLCKVRNCVNPDHMEPVTMAENVRRAVSWNGSKTHCPNGHEYSVDNVLLWKDGRRRCRTCQNERVRRRKE